MADEIESRVCGGSFKINKIDKAIAPCWKTVDENSLPGRETISHHTYARRTLYAKPLGVPETRSAGGGELGEQIGRIFAHRVAICFGQLFENYKSSPHFGAIFS
jgi:hypothetical protein